MIEVKNLYFSFYTGSVLKDINIKLYSGETMCLFGQNGAGKSTLLKCIAGINIVDSGEIKICGNISNNRDAYFSDLGCFFNKDGLYDFLTVEENYKLFLSYYKLSKIEIQYRINQYCTALGVGDVLRKRINKLSSGQKQKVSLALTFMHNPKVLLFDEPLNNLDAHFIEKFYALVNDYIYNNQACAIIVNHDILNTPIWINYISIIKNGNISLKENNDLNLKTFYNSIALK